MIKWFEAYRSIRRIRIEENCLTPFGTKAFALRCLLSRSFASIMSLTTRLPEWSNPMPVLLWLLGVPILVILALYVFHIL